jgi:hypothetical protein
MNKSEEVLITLPPGNHFAGHPGHMHEGKLSMRVRLEFVKDTRQQKYQDMFYFVNEETTRPQCICRCGSTINVQRNVNGEYELLTYFLLCITV